jgi:hypothetical protein
MVSFNRDTHKRAHERVSQASHFVTAAQSAADELKPSHGEFPSVEYLEAVSSLVDAVGYYGDALATLGSILHWKTSIPSYRGKFRA